MRAARHVARLAIAPALAAVVAVGCGGPDDGLGSVSTVLVAERGASNPTVALDGGGGATYVAWVATEGDESNVFIARAENDGAFGEVVRVNDIPGDAAPHAQAPARVATGPDGSVYVVWQNNTVVEGRRFPASDLRFARSHDGGRTFGPAIHVNDDAGGPPASHTFHDMAVGPNGTIFVSWIDGRAGAGGGGGGPEIRVARSTDGGRTFDPSRVVDGDACPCCRTSLAVGPGDDDDVYVAWRKEFAGSVRDIVVARSEDGGLTFSAPVRVHADDWVIDACPHAGPALAVDLAGRVHIAWYTGAEGRAGAYLATSGAGLDFAAPIALGPTGGTPTTQVAMASGHDGGVWVGWEDVEGDGATIRLAGVTEDGPPRGVAIDAPNGLLPSLSAAGPRVALAWLDGDRVRVLRGEAAKETERETETTRPPVGRPAPDYAAATLAGDTVTLAELRGDVILLNVWATWCVPCRQEMPDLQVIADRYADEGLRVVGVSIDQAGARTEVRRFVDQHGIDFTILHDPDGRVARAFRTIGVPETFLLDRHGTIRARWTGRLPKAEAEERVREVLQRG